MVDVEQSFWIQQRIKQYASKTSDQGSQINMRCFVCGDSRKNQSKKRGYYYKNTCSYYCFNCGTNLHGVKIVSTLENRPFKDVKTEYLMERYGKNFKSKKEKYNKPKFELKLDEFTNKLPQDVFKYLEDRKILKAPFLSEDAEFLYDENTNRLVIPWYLDERVVYYQKRTLDETQQPKYLFPFGVDKSVYNIDKVDPAFPYIFVLEGALDSIYVYNGVAIGGKNITQHQRKLIKTKFPKHKIVYFLDNHHNESAMKTHLLRLAEKEPSSSFLLFPDAMKNIKDINQWIVADGPNMFKHCKWLERNIISSLKLKFTLSSSK
tara:strand:- start:2598 stop:3557 length:960 start_codon:yes stop_codon:yes gene_type:complete